MRRSRPDEQKIFNAALDLPAWNRQAFLDKACGDDAELRASVEELLRVHEANRSLVEAPIAAEQVTLRLSDVSQKPGDIIDRYKLLQQIGEGGFGVVYMAEQTEPIRRRVALKVIKLGMDTREVIARFDAERQALALMDHPNIARVLDAGTTATGRPYFVMELVRGVPITDYCDQNNLSTEQRLALFAQTCSAVQHAHQKGVIHRDLKPSNVLVTLHDGTPLPKVIDFGIAKAMDRPLTERTLFTQFGQFVGTPQYMSPEQAAMTALDVDTRSDVYSLGVLLYELLTGTTPFQAHRLRALAHEEACRIIREEEPPKPSTRISTLGERATEVAKHRHTDPAVLSKQVRGDLDWIVMKALEKDRTRRYETPSAFAEDIRRHLRDEPVVAGPPSTAYRLRKLLRRNRVAVTVGGVVLASIIVGLTLATFGWIRARIAQAAAETRRQEAVAARDEEARQRHAADEARRRAEQANYLSISVLSASKAKDGLFGEVQELLRQAPLEHRDWEWGRLMYLCHPELLTLRWQSERLHHNALSAAFSSDARRIVTAHGDGTARIWDAETGEELSALKGHEGFVQWAGFSPDGGRVLTAGADWTARIWDADTGRQLHVLVATDPPPDGSGRLRLTSLGVQVAIRAAFCAGGTRVVTAGVDREGYVLKLWDSQTGRLLVTVTHGGTAGVPNVAPPPGISAFAVSPDGTRIVTGSANFGSDGDARIWDAETGRQLHVLGGHVGPVTSVAFSPDGERLLTADDEKVRIWATESGQELLPLGAGAKGTTWAAFSPDGSQVWTLGEGTAGFWDAATGREVRNLELPGASLVGFSDDGQRILGRSRLDAFIWDAVSGELVVSLEGHGIAVNSVALSPDDRRALTAGSDGTVRIWDAQRDGRYTDLRDGWQPGSEAKAVAFSPDGGQAAAGGSIDVGGLPVMGAVCFWDTRDGRLDHVQKWPSVRPLAFSQDGRRMLVLKVVRENEPRQWQAAIWDARTGAEETLLAMDSATEVVSAAFAPDGDRVVTGAAGGAVQVWDARTGRQLLLFQDGQARLHTVSFSPDGTRLLIGDRLVGASQGRLLIRDAATGQVLVACTYPDEDPHFFPNACAAFSADGRRVAVGGDYGASVWDAETGQMLTDLGVNPFPVAVDFVHEVSAVAFSPDGRRVVTVSRKGDGRIWDVETGMELMALAGGPGAGRCLAFSPDGRLLLAAGYSARILEALNWTLPPDEFKGMLDKRQRERYGKWLARQAKVEDALAAAERPPEGSRLPEHER
jgi:WD40 repeat protein/serine/threonine protein kinase